MWVLSGGEGRMVMKRSVQKIVSIAMLLCMLLTIGNVSSNTDVVMPYGESITENDAVN